MSPEIQSRAWMTLLHFTVLSALIACGQGATQCEMCLPGGVSCFSTNCSSAAESTCIIVNETNTLGGKTPSTTTYKDCVEICHPTIVTVTTSLGRQVRSHSACCHTSDCNKGMVLGVPPASTSPNGVECPACEGFNTTPCVGAHTIGCTGLEDQCVMITATPSDGAGNFSLRGCATSSTCHLTRNDILSFGGKIYRLSEDAQCKHNGVPKATPAFPSFLLYVVWLVLLDLFC